MLGRRGTEVLEMAMGKLSFALAIAISILPRTGHAQEKEDMTQVTCTDYLRMPPSLARIYDAWMSGWYSQKFSNTTGSLDDLARNVTSVRQWCTDNPQATVMAALDNSVPQSGPPIGQDKIDMALVTCKQYLTSDADRQAMIGFWMSGYFRTSKNQPIFDFEIFADNNGALTNYCKKHESETVFSAIENGAR
jgi:acid stress chaperone HdeB